MRHRSLSRRRLLGALAASSVLLASCDSLPAGLRLATPTPTGPRKVRVAVPDVSALAFMQSQLRTATNHLPDGHNLDIEAVPVPVSASSFDEMSTSYVSALTAESSGTAFDLVLVHQGMIPAMDQGGALQDLAPSIRSERWFKEDDFFGNVLDTGKARGRLLGLPLSAWLEVMLYNRQAFDDLGVPLPPPGWTWDQFLVSARELTRSGADRQRGHWGFYVGPQSPSLFTMAWQRGARVVGESSDEIDLLEPGTIEAMEFLASLIHVHKVAPADEQLVSNPGLAFDALTRRDVAMTSVIAGDTAWWRTRDEIVASELPIANQKVSLGYVGLMVGIPRNPPDEARSLDALSGLIEASSWGLLLPTRRGVDDLRKIEVTLTEADANALSGALESVRFLPSDFSFALVELLDREYILPILLGKKRPKEAGQEAQSLIEQYFRQRRS